MMIEYVVVGKIEKNLEDSKTIFFLMIY